MKKKKPPQFEPGERLLSVQCVTDEITAGRYIFYNGRPMHPGFSQNLRLTTMILAVRNGKIRKAIKIESE